MITKTRGTIKKADAKINTIVKHIMPVKPDKVILFGSYARGGAYRDSDVDLLIIKKTNDNPSKRAYEVRRCLNTIDTAFDILVFTPQEINSRLAMNDLFVKDILEKGTVIYEKRQHKTSAGMV